MADKTKKKKVNLDEVNPLDLASVINPDLAVAVAQAQQQPQGEIRMPRSTQRRITDELAGSIKAQLSGRAPVSPWLAYPAAGAVVSSLANPVTAVTSGLKGLAGATAVDLAGKLGHGKTWAEDVSETFDINPEVAAFTNPGVLMAGASSGKNKSIDFSTFRKNIGNFAKKYASLGSDKASERLSLSNVGDRLNLSYTPTLSNTSVNYGSVINLPNSGSVIEMGEKVSPTYRRNLLKRINKIFASRYGYKSIPLKASESREATEAAIKDLMTQHNTFVRGVRDEAAHIDATNEKLIQLGLEPTTENRLMYYATRYAGDTGHGRMNFNQRGTNLGTIYTSNMVPVAKGYAARRHPGEEGTAYVVRRPLDFSSPNMEDWVINNEFKFSGKGHTLSGNNYFDYELPYYLRTGKSLRSEYLADNPASLAASYKDIVARETEKYFNNPELSVEAANRRRAELKRYADKHGFDFEFPESSIDKSHYGVGLANLENDLLSRIGSRHFIIEQEPKSIRKFFAEHPGYYSPQYYGSNGTRFVFKDGNRASHMIKTGIFNFEEPDFGHPDFDATLSLQLNDFIQANKRKGISDAIRGYYYGNRKHVSDNSKKALERRISNRIKQLYVDRARDVAKNIESYAKSKGLEPTTPRSVLFGDRVGSNVTINGKDNPWQHFVFVGPVDEQGLEPVKTIPWSELKTYPNMRGGHIGTYTPGLSRKVKELGGYVSRPTLATGGRIAYRDGGIHINPANRGKLTETMKRTGKTKEELSHSKNPLTRKRAIFALNAEKWNHKH